MHIDIGPIIISETTALATPNCYLKLNQAEEYYTFGPGSKRKYNKLKRKYPSYTDEYELISFENDIDEESGILVNVRRISDKKKFTLPLADLEAVNKKSKNGVILDDYAVWFVNYR